MAITLASSVQIPHARKSLLDRRSLLQNSVPLAERIGFFKKSSAQNSLAKLRDSSGRNQGFLKKLQKT